MKKTLIFFACVMLLALCASCSQDNDAIPLDVSEPLALAPDIEWAVVVDPYAAFRVEPKWDADTAGHCRKGDVLQVKSKTVATSAGIWYEFGQGWLHEDVVSVYTNRYKAVTASERIKL